MQQQQAYDFETFMPREERERTQRLRVAEPREKKPLLKRRNLSWVKYIVVGAVVLALIASALEARITSMKLTDQINTAKDQLSALQSEYAYLTNEAEMKLNSSDIENAAQGLGLYEPEQSQITYVERDEEDTIVLPKNNLERTLEQVTTGALSIMEYLKP